MILKKFGLEIRKIGNFSQLYKEVDMVLSRSTNIEEQTVAHGLQDMFKPGGHFNICFIKTAMEIGNIVIPRERMVIYEAIHCLSWSDMEKEYRITIQAMVMDDFRSMFCPENEFIIIDGDENV